MSLKSVGCVPSMRASGANDGSARAACAACAAWRAKLSPLPGSPRTMSGARGYRSRRPEATRGRLPADSVATAIQPVARCADSAVATPSAIRIGVLPACPVKGPLHPVAALFCPTGQRRFTSHTVDQLERRHRVANPRRHDQHTARERLFRTQRHVAKQRLQFECLEFAQRCNRFELLAHEVRMLGRNGPRPFPDRHGRLRHSCVARTHTGLSCQRAASRLRRANSSRSGPGEAAGTVPGTREALTSKPCC